MSGGSDSSGMEGGGEPEELDGLLSPLAERGAVAASGAWRREAAGRGLGAMSPFLEALELLLAAMGTLAVGAAMLTHVMATIYQVCCTVQVKPEK